jgi:hypothetical protein
MASITDIRAELRVRPIEARARILTALRGRTIGQAAAELGCNMRTLQRILAADTALAKAGLAVRSESSLRSASAVEHRWV